MSLRDLVKQSLSTEAAPRRQKRTQQQTLQALAMFLLVRLIKGVRTTLHDCAEEVGHKSTNALATALGRGTGGSGGANAWVFNGEIVECQENIGIFVVSPQPSKSHCCWTGSE